VLILVTGSIWCEIQVKTTSDAVYLSKEPPHMVAVRSGTSISDFLKDHLKIHIQLQQTV